MIKHLRKIYECIAMKGILKLRTIKEQMSYPLLHSVHTLRFLRHRAPKVIIYCTQTAPKLRPQHVRQILLRTTFLLGIVSIRLYRKQDNRGIIGAGMVAERAERGVRKPAGGRHWARRLLPANRYRL